MMEKIDKIDAKLDDVLKTINDTQTDLAVFTVFFKNHAEKIEEIKASQKIFDNRLEEQKKEIEELRDEISKIKIEKEVAFKTIKRIFLCLAFVATTYVYIAFYI